MKYLRLVLLILAIIALVGVGFWYWQKRQITTVTVAAISRQDLTKAISAPGEIKTKDESVIFSSLSGTIKQLNFKDLASVDENAVILSFDKKPFELAYNQALANYWAAKASQEEAKEVSQTQKKQLEANAAAAWKAYEQAKDNLGKVEVKAESSGVLLLSQNPVSGQKLQAGQVVTAGQELFKIFNPEKLEFEVQLDETDWAQAKLLQSAKIKLDAYPGVVLEGTIQKIAPHTQLTASGVNVILATIQLSQSDLSIQLVPGLSGDASIEIEIIHDVITLPSEAVLFEKEQAFVWVVENNQVYKRRIELGEEVGGIYEVKNGLNQDEEVVIENVEKLKQEERVRISNDLK